jgi:acetylglutamate kinase
VRARVVKVGGNRAADGGWMREVAEGIASSPRPTVLVHGGGAEVSALQRALGTEPEWREGLRVTTPATFEAVRMVLSGSVNKRWVAALLDAGADALGVSGEDASLLVARVTAGGRLGRTGEVERVRAPLLLTWLAAGLVPVISPVSRGPDGGLNGNSDNVSAAVAAALAAAELLFVSDVAAVRGGGAAVEALDAEGIEHLLASGEAADGMRPKLRAALAARRAGVAAVRIGGAAMLGEPRAGTRIEHGEGAVHAGC